MRLIFSPIYERIGRAGRHMQSRLVLRLVTVAAFDRENAKSVSTAPQAERSVWATVLALKWSIPSRMTIDAPRVTEHLERFQKSCPRIRIIA
jgi:hypothetical protein